MDPEIESQGEAMDYLRAETITTTMKVEVREIAEFGIVIKKCKPNMVFIHKDQTQLYQKILQKYGEDRQKLRITESKQDEILHFAFFDSGILYETITYGYPSIEEMEKEKKAGFVFKHIAEEAKKVGFEEYKDFYECRTQGFLNKETWEESKRGGFSDFNTYSNAKSCGFTQSIEYTEACSNGISKKEIYDAFKAMDEQKRKYEVDYSDEVLLLELLNCLPPKEVLASERIWNMLNEKKKDFINKGYSWFTQRLKSKEITEGFLESPKAKKIGSFDRINYIFERKDEVKIRKNSVVVDGSNVAWAHGSRQSGDTPKIGNIILVYDHLKKFGFAKIDIFIDANLKYDIDEKDSFEKIKRKYNIQDIPAGTQADRYIIDFAKQSNCFILTNDTFKKDYLLEDQWLRMNIDDIRIPFVIRDNIVILGKSLS